VRPEGSRHDVHQPTIAVNSTGSGGGNRAGPRVMRAIVQHGDGTDEVLGLEQVAAPEIAADEVLVRVHAAGLDRGTWHLMTGRPYLMRIMGYGVTKPKHPVAGLDVSGTVVAVGGDPVRSRR
jgi:NADPH:quinone reductase-like Zn-dependent oxidoreductase